MVVSAKVYVTHPNIALGHTIRSLPDARVGVVSDAGTDPHHDSHYFWFEAPDFDAVSTALAADHTVADFTPIVERESRWTYRIDYSDEAMLITPTIAALGGLTLDSRSHLNGWVLDLELTDHEALYALDEYASEREIHLDVLKLDHSERSAAHRAYGLTEAQREALVAAYVNGYFDDPRRTSLEELSDLLDISPTALSGRLRRGSTRLIEGILLDSKEE